jgi:hypothetical protein
LGTPLVGPSLNVPRSGLSVTTGKVTASTKFLYAIGGGYTELGNATNVVERAQITVFGSLNPWRISPSDFLPVNRTFGSLVSAGRYLYYMGGMDQLSASTNDVYRSELLDPLDAPIVNIDINVTNFNTTFQAGLYQYRVSAIFGNSNNRNPNGESLPSPLVPILVPNIGNISVILSWDPIPNAVGYRVYRTPTPFSLSSSMQLVAEISDTSFYDYGNKTVSNTSPLQAGNIGKWAKVDSMNFNRAAHRSLSVKSNLNDNIYYIYAMSGKNQSTYEILSVNISTNPPAVTKNWTTQTWPDSGRSFFGLWQVKNSDKTVVPVGETWIYATGGYLNSVATDITLAGKVLDNGTVSFTTTGTSDNLKATAYGFCGIQAAGVCYRVAGNSVESGAYEAAYSLAPPKIDGSKSFGPSGGYAVSQARRYLDCVAESALMIFIGGYNGTDVSGVVDYSVQ